MNKFEYIRKRQPHFQHPGHTFSVTVLAHDAVPRARILRLQQERQSLLNQLPPHSSDYGLQKAMIYSNYEAKLEQLLHRSDQQTYPFQEEAIAQEIMRTVKEYDGKYYDLEVACIMSNHAHLLLNFSRQEIEDQHGSQYINLSKVVGMIKGKSSYLINKVRGQKTAIWSQGYYDRYIRSHEHFSQAFYYILYNPVKAGMVNVWSQYPYTYVSEENLAFFLS